MYPFFNVVKLHKVIYENQLTFTLWVFEDYLAFLMTYRSGKMKKKNRKKKTKREGGGGVRGVGKEEDRE